MATPTTYRGSCSCGAIQIEIKGDPAHALCHCRNCHKTTSSAYSTNWVVPRPNFAVTKGVPTTYEALGGSGNKAQRQFCNQCSCTMWTESPLFAGIVVVKAGVLDDGAFEKFAPTSETFVSRKPAWVPCIDGAVQFAEAFQMPKKEE